MSNTYVNPLEHKIDHKLVGLKEQIICPLTKDYKTPTRVMQKIDSNRLVLHCQPINGICPYVKNSLNNFECLKGKILPKPTRQIPLLTISTLPQIAIHIPVIGANTQ